LAGQFATAGRIDALGPVAGRVGLWRARNVGRGGRWDTPNQPKRIHHHWLHVAAKWMKDCQRRMARLFDFEDLAVRGSAVVGRIAFVPSHGARVINAV